MKVTMIRNEIRSIPIYVGWTPGFVSLTSKIEEKYLLNFCFSHVLFSCVFQLAHRRETRASCKLYFSSIYYGKAIERYEGLRLRLPTPDPESSRQASYGVSRSFQLHTPPISGCVR